MPSTKAKIIIFEMLLLQVNLSFSFLSVKEAQNKWKLLREKYGKVRRLIQRSGASNDSTQHEWGLYKLLKFLDPHIVGRRYKSLLYLNSI